MNTLAAQMLEAPAAKRYISPHKPFNAYRIDGDRAYIALVNKAGATVAEAVVDLDTLEGLCLLNRRWSLAARGYVIREGEARKVIRLHRVIMDAPEGMVVDHIDRNTLNNMRVNLRIVTTTENNSNRNVSSNSSTGVRGVHYYPNRRRPYLVRLRQVGVKPVSIYVYTLNIARLTAALLRAQTWGAEAV